MPDEACPPPRSPVTLVSRMKLPTLRTLARAAPWVFVAHVLEEAPGFVAWFNATVEPDIRQRTFLVVNGAALLVTHVVARVAASEFRVPALAFAAWTGFLFLANGLFHLVATIAHERYCPGVVTGTLVYLPYGALVLRGIARERGVRGTRVLGVAALGAAPMLAHGYLIVFEGSRLF